MSADTGGGHEPARPPRHLVVGHITKAHGTHGELFVWPLTSYPDTVFAPGRLLLVGDQEGALPGDAPSVVLTAVRPFKRGFLVSLEGVERREDAEALAQQYLLAPLEELEPLAEGEVFYHELLGLTVVTVAGESVGTVREVYEAVPNDLLEIQAPDGRLRLVPFAERIVREVDADAGRIVIDPPEGLLDL